MAQGVLRFRFSMDAGEQTTVSLSLLIFKNHSWQNATDKVLQYLCDYHKLEDDLQRVFTHTMASKNFHRVQRLSTLANDPWYMLSKGNAVETKYIPYTVVNSFFAFRNASHNQRAKSSGHWPNPSWSTVICKLWEPVRLHNDWQWETWLQQRGPQPQRESQPKVYSSPPPIFHFNKSMSMSIVNLYSAQSRNICTALSVY